MTTENKNAPMPWLNLAACLRDAQAELASARRNGDAMKEAIAAAHVDYFTSALEVAQ